MSKNYKLKNGKYIKIDKTDEGFEYSFYEETKKLIDGGIITTPKFNDMQVLKEVLKILEIPENIEFVELNEEIEELYE